jgi:hypothetical protein
VDAAGGRGFMSGQPRPRHSEPSSPGVAWAGCLFARRGGGREGETSQHPGSQPYAEATLIATIMGCDRGSTQAKSPRVLAPLNARLLVFFSPEQFSYRSVLNRKSPFLFNLRLLSRVCVIILGFVGSREGGGVVEATGVRREGVCVCFF